MLKSRTSVILSILLSLVMLFCTACGEQKEEGGKINPTGGSTVGTSSTNKDTASKEDTTSKEDTSKEDSSKEEISSKNDSTSSNSSVKETVIKVESYAEGDKKDLLKFDKGLDMFGEKSINIIGDSISQGFNAPKLYDQSWVSLFKNALNAKNGTYNLGFVSLHHFDDWGVEDCSEIHNVQVTKPGWVKKSGTESGNTPGCYSYTAAQFTEGATLEISVNRKEGGIDRHINGFYIYYIQGATYGSFEIKINGKSVKTIDCSNSAYNSCARTPYIQVPADCGDMLTVEIIKLTNGVAPVTISGISYVDKPGAVTVNNYSLGGLQTLDLEDDLLRELAKANIVIFTMGTNDAGLKNDINEFKRKLSVVVDACKENGSTLIVGDVIWARDGNDWWATEYKNALKQMAKDANGYFIDFTTIPISKVLDLVSDKRDICHPTVEGHKLLAEKLCSFFEVKMQ